MSDCTRRQLQYDVEGRLSAVEAPVVSTRLRFSEPLDANPKAGVESGRILNWDVKGASSAIRADELPDGTGARRVGGADDDAHGADCG